MPLPTKFKQQLKGRAHKLKPVILIGQQGLTNAVQKEIDRALEAHELIKIQIASDERDLRQEIFTEICKVQQAELVQTIGKIAVIYRKNEED